MSETDERISSFRPVPRTGVIYVTTEARKRGFSPESTDWCNLGQGQPEAGELEGAPPRVRQVTIDLDDHEYAPVAGLDEVRQAVADLYNELYRQGKASKYTAENVAICGGGRLALTRVVASLGHINLGHFLPDYTAYEELLDIFRSFTSIPILLDPKRNYEFTIEELQREILGRGLGGLLVSNPCNPTGKLLHGEVLKGWVDTARDLDCTMLFDEFYSNYI
ncbi:MAG: aminotransferase class I/II-fold pyridoxal phosphate-dependent enzyme, partial [Myxococcota bacterium]|nr:aminotransferase class I/II-fold pyridoxal phosphate-dependent enzyme [Myxococcota bacterium]